MIYGQRTGLSVGIVFCAFFLTAGVAVCAQTDSNDLNGPTVMFSYNTSNPLKTPASTFMYFIPLVSPTLVSTEISPDNQQQSTFISYKKSVASSSFAVSCEFELHGSGFFTDIFDSSGIIDTFSEEMKKNAPIHNLLDYIRLEGEGSGRIDVKGTVTDSNLVVTQVDVHFNTRGGKTPVTIGLYSIKPVNGQYKYENKYNEIVAQVATLTFKKCDGEPRMGIEVISVNKASKPNTYIGRVKGFIVNFFIDPIKISKLGNDTMLNFGYALLNKQPLFTFPKAMNIKPQKPVKAESSAK